DLTENPDEEPGSGGGGGAGGLAEGGSFPGLSAAAGGGGGRRGVGLSPAAGPVAGAACHPRVHEPSPLHADGGSCTRAPHVSGSAYLAVTPWDDDLAEGDETVHATLEAGEDYTVDQGEADLTLFDDGTDGTGGDPDGDDPDGDDPDGGDPEGDDPDGDDPNGG